LGGKVNMKLGYVPVYIEESNGNLAEYVPKDLSPIASSTPPVQTQLQQNQTQQKPGSDCVQSCIATGKQPQQCLQQCLGSQTPVSTSSKTGTNQAPPAGTNPSCGDGVCGPREKSGEIPCPADCK
jgi:hypothetical protein